MKVKLSQAVKMFFANSSLEMVYFEAVANALDAGATNINIRISAESYSKAESLQIIIQDNGEGFTDARYQKFCNLFDVESAARKGLGRLVYLSYFDKIAISSNYDGNYRREFVFADGFDEKQTTVVKTTNAPSGAIFTMSGYSLSKLRQHSYIQPKYLIGRILEEFYIRLYDLREKGVIININITSNIENTESSESLSNNSLPILKKKLLSGSTDLFSKFILHYHIEEVEPSQAMFISALSVDDRTFKVDIIAQENHIANYKMIFLLFSDSFEGKVDHTRQKLTIEEAELQRIQSLFKSEIATVIEKELPQIAERNKKTHADLAKRYPHLSGYFPKENIGYDTRNDVLKKAQERFFKAQKELLEAHHLDDEQFQKSLEISARALTEYILFRQLTITALRETEKSNSEAELHKLFAPMKVQFDKENAVSNLYQNNAWLLDDKYMTYEAVLSDKEMGDLISFITKEDTPRDDDRPDIALVFSKDPAQTTSFDVVIVELKKRGLSLEDNMKVITQLEKRARKLMEFYKNQIQRIWYYGIVEFNEELELALSGEYAELYSSGKMYYKETNIALSLKPKRTLPIGVFIWDLDAVVADADARNAAFLQLIKSKFSQS